MNPSALRIRAISIFIRLDGIMTVSCRAPAALRIRVTMSPTGSFTATPRGRRAFGTIVRRGRGASPSVRSGRGACGSGVVVVASVVIFNSPTALRHAWKLADEGPLAEADPAQAELAHVRARAAAHLPPVAALRRQRRRLRRRMDRARLPPLATPRAMAERHPR